VVGRPGTSLGSVFAPTSVAVYGASARDSTRLGNQLLRNATGGLGSGTVVAIHPGATEIAGAPARAALGEPVDLALISVPAPAVETALRDAADGGARAAIVLSSGFGETGTAGIAAERRLVDIAREAAMPLIGPNCMGVVSRLGPESWLNASYFWSVPSLPGPISFISQSGAFGGMFFSELTRRHLGLARFVSLGNSADVTETDVLEWLADDEETGVVALFSEAIRDGRRFVDAARRVSAEKPVVVLKGGKGVAGARAAASHTGSMAGRHGAARAAFRRAGVVEAADSMSFFDSIAALAASRGTTRAGRRVVIVTVSGGPGVLAADVGERIGLQLVTPSETSVDKLRALVPSFAATGNPVDLTPQCRPDRYGEAFEVLAADPGIDGMVVINCGLDVAEFGAAAAAAADTGIPMTAFVLDAPSVTLALERAGVALFDGPERAVVGYATRTRR